MNQERQLVFIGGVQGSGKTAIIDWLVKNRKYQKTKQRHVLLEIGKTKGLSWEEIGRSFYDYLNQVIDLIVERFVNQQFCPVLLVDCHYAIRVSKALRLNGKMVEDEYIYDLEPRLVERLAEYFQVRFVLLEVDPMIALERLGCRSSDLLDYECTWDGHLKQTAAERRYFEKFIQTFRIKSEDMLLLDNSGEFCQSIKELCQFIDYMDTARQP